MTIKYRDIKASLACGEVASWFILIIFYTLGLEAKVGPRIFGFSFRGLTWSLLAFLPLLFLLGVIVAFWLASLYKIFSQLIKFVEVGILNTFVDLGVLSLLMAAAGITGGIWYAVFKGLSFLTATFNSYLWNKIWTFQKEGFDESPREFSEFLMVSGIGLVINVSAASIVVNWLGPQFGLAAEVWGIIGAIIAAICGMSWNFLGYKFFVFKK